MLLLLQTPGWQAAGEHHLLPDTVPGWLLAFLALADDWVGRERLAATFWPDAAGAEALANLRVNLHRVRQQLQAWGAEDSLLAERRRVRLDLPHDVRALQAALAAGRGEEALALYRQPLLQGLAFPGFAVLQEWAELERAALHRRCRETLLALADTPGRAPAQGLAVAQHLAALDPLDEEAARRQVLALRALGRETDASQAFITFEQRLAQDLGVAPSPAMQALAPARPGPAAAHATEPALPRDAFVGRAAEMAQLAAMLAQDATRVVTLLGPGGVGKSRLARQWQAAQRETPLWVALGQARSLEDAQAALAAALGLVLDARTPVAQALQRALAARRAPVVLDDVEQAAGLGPWLAASCEAAPQLRWVVTSRVALGIAGERVLALEGLDHAVDGAASEALHLLQLRTRALDPGFDAAAQAPACAALVQRVGGWPLAIELLAQALAVQPAAAVLEDLAQSLDTLAAARAPDHARHDSVRASLALSWRLLDPAARQALARLSVFRGGFTRAAALVVSESGGPVLAALVDRLLVHNAGSGRWTLHPLVAQFAAGQLGADEAEANARHADYYLDQMRRWSARRDDVAGTAVALQADLDNVVQAWRHAVAQRSSAALGEGAAAWTHFCNAKGRARDVHRWLQEALPATAGDEAARGALLLAMANAHYRAGDFDDAAALAREAAASADARGAAQDERSARNVLALSLLPGGHVDEAARHAHEALASARAAAAEGELGSIANTCAILARHRGDLDAAAALYGEAIEVHRRLGNHRGLAVALNNLGNVWRTRDRRAEAAQCFEECLRLCDRHGIESSRAFALGNLGLVAFADGRLDAARSHAERTLAEPAAEPSMTMAALALLSRVALARSDAPEAARQAAACARMARAHGLHGAMLEALHCHALGLVAAGDPARGAAVLAFVARHPKVAAQARQAALSDLERIAPDPAARTRAEAYAQALDLDALVDEVVRGG